MSVLKQRSVIRTTSLGATALLCVLLASVMAENGSSNGLLKKKPSVVLQASKASITFPCPPGFHSSSCPSTFDLQVPLTATADGFNKQDRYTYTVSGGRVIGEGSKVSWNFDGVGPGRYTATVEVHDNKKHRALSSVIVTILNCGDCVNIEPCPTLVVNCYDQVKAGTVGVCKVVMGSFSNLVSHIVTYEWSVNASSGEDLSERITSRGTSISIPTNGLAGQTVYVRVTVKGLDPSCSGTVTGSTVVKP